MKRILFLTALCAALAAQAPAQPLPVAPNLPAIKTQADAKAPVTVQFPQENAVLPRGASHAYLFGKLHLQNPTLQINGTDVPVRKNGTFIAYLPVEQGPFQFVLTAQAQGKTHQAVRNVRVAGAPIKDFTGKAAFDPTQVYPALPLWARRGDVVNLSVRGTPAAQVSAELAGLKGGKNIALKEDAREAGLYRAKYFIRENEKPRTAKITYKLHDPATKTRAKVTAKEKLKILDEREAFPLARVLDGGVKMRQLPVRQGSLYPYYRAYGDVVIDGRDNGLYRVRLSKNEAAWLEEKKLKTLPFASYAPNAVLQLQTLSTGSKTALRLQSARPVPVSIHEFSNRMEITLYYTGEFIENFDFDATSPVIDRVEWSRPDEGVLKFVVYFKPSHPLWGHGYRWEENDFVTDFYHRPALTPQKDKPLLGARILLDAGHSPKRTPPYDGLVSPSGFLEYEANLALAEALKPKLEAAGAHVIMTRQGQNRMSLTDRYHKALAENAHIFISLHHNALPDTVNPLSAPRGYSVYYTYPHSFKLAESVYQSFNRQVDLPDNGLIANDVLFIPRIAEMPSILVENAYMILPEQEELVMSDKGRALFAQTLYQGILDFYGVKSAAPQKRRKPRR